MKTIRINLGIDLATTENVEEAKYLSIAAASIRKQLPDYKFAISVTADDNAETKIVNRDELPDNVVQNVENAIVEAESAAISDPKSYNK